MQDNFIRINLQSVHTIIPIGKMSITGYTGWDFRMWPLAELTEWLHSQGFRRRKCISASPRQEEEAVIVW